MKIFKGLLKVRSPISKVINTHDSKSVSKGHTHTYFKQDEPIKKGDKIYDILNIQTLEIMDTAYSPIDRMMIYLTYRAVTKPSELLCSINNVVTLRESY